MPIYEYECTQCKQTFEILQKFNDSPLEKCILCHGGPVRKLISTSAFVLKGAGFYVNDYPSASRKKGVESEKNGSPEKKSESPPESKSEKAEKVALPEASKVS